MDYHLTLPTNFWIGTFSLRVLRFRLIIVGSQILQLPSPFFLACKRGLFDLIQVFVERGADVHVADGFQRTPLHYLAWSSPPCFKSARLLLEKDASLLYATDSHGKTPLNYVSDEYTSQWLRFIEMVKDEFWPKLPIFTTYAPQARLDCFVKDPPGALPVNLAKDVAGGRLLPEEAMRNKPSPN